MPYINQERRTDLANEDDVMTHAGELNYLLTQLCVTYLRLKGERYQTYNDIIGALESCKLELYRRKIAPYEDKKRDENGEVY